MASLVTVFQKTGKEDITDPRQIAASIVGAVDWQTEVSGFCRCPGEALHTQHNGKKDCRISVDGAPTIFCFHTSCASVVADADRKLRCAIGQSPWEITLPGGCVLRSGDILQKDGTVKTQAQIIESHLTVIGLHLAVNDSRQKNPEDSSALRVEQGTSSLAASAPFRTATILAMTPFLPTVVAAMVITTLIAIVVARTDNHDRTARRRGHIDHRRWAMHYGRRARRGVNHDRARGTNDWHGQPKIDADRNSCLGGAGQSDCGNHCYQTEQMFCFHGRSDDAVIYVFDSRPLIKTEDY